MLCCWHFVVNKMAFTLYSLLEATLLCLNAVCILHEERFLAKSMTANVYCLCSCRNVAVSIGGAWSIW